jgi:signal transduction histidine kinase
MKMSEPDRLITHVTRESPPGNVTLSLDESAPPKPIPTSVTFLLIGIGLIGFAILVWNHALGRVIQETDLRPVLGTASLVILLGIAGLYLFMFRFYGDEFYAFVAVAWFGNAVYMFLEGFLRPLPSEEWRVALFIYVFAQLSFIPFYLATLRGRIPREQRRGIGQLLCLLALMFVSFLLGRLWSLRHGLPVASFQTLLVSTVGAIPFAFWTIWRVGRSVRRRLSTKSHGLWAWALPATFYAYAAMQLFSPLRLYSDLRLITNMIFGAALIMKIVNLVSAAMILVLDSNARLKRRSVLEELGALTASIEHDVSNPLQVISTIIDGMKERFQANREVVAGLEKIEEQNQRIFASTEIVSILRGGRDFYGRFVEKASIGDVVSKSIRAVKIAVNTDGIHFVREDDKTLYTRAYRPLLQQAFVNVLKNAVEAIRFAGREKGVIKVVSAERHDLGEITVEISDNGGGIPASALRKLGHFYTTKKERKPNSGIGLFISSRILEFHDGKLQIQSLEGEGTTVRLTVPRWQPEKRVTNSA